MCHPQQQQQQLGGSCAQTAACVSSTSFTSDTPIQHRWEQDFELLVHEPEHQQLTAVLLEHHALDKDDEVGRVSIPIDQLAVGEMQDMWLDLGPPGTDEQSSLLSLSVSLFS